MGWDSNPRDGLPPAGFQDRCLQPLGHPSRSARLMAMAAGGKATRRPECIPLRSGQPAPALWISALPVRSGLRARIVTIRDRIPDKAEPWRKLGECKAAAGGDSRLRSSPQGKVGSAAHRFRLSGQCLTPSTIRFARADAGQFASGLLSSWPLPGTLAPAGQVRGMAAMSGSFGRNALIRAFGGC